MGGDEINKIFVNLGYDAPPTPRSNDKGLDHILNGEIVVQTKNQKNKGDNVNLDIEDQTGYASPPLRKKSNPL